MEEEEEKEGGRGGEKWERGRRIVFILKKFSTFSALSFSPPPEQLFECLSEIMCIIRKHTLNMMIVVKHGSLVETTCFPFVHHVSCGLHTSVHFQVLS